MFRLCLELDGATMGGGNPAACFTPQPNNTASGCLNVTDELGEPFVRDGPPVTVRELKDRRGTH